MFSFFLRQNAYYLVHILSKYLKLLGKLKSRLGIWIQQLIIKSKTKSTHSNYFNNFFLQKTWFALIHDKNMSIQVLIRLCSVHASMYPWYFKWTILKQLTSVTSGACFKRHATLRFCRYKCQPSGNHCLTEPQLLSQSFTSWEYPSSQKWPVPLVSGQVWL